MPKTVFVAGFVEVPDEWTHEQAPLLMRVVKGQRAAWTAVEVSEALQMLPPGDAVNQYVLMAFEHARHGFARQVGVTH